MVLEYYERILSQTKKGSLFSPCCIFSWHRSQTTVPQWLFPKLGTKVQKNINCNHIPENKVSKKMLFLWLISWCSCNCLYITTLLSIQANMEMVLLARLIICVGVMVHGSGSTSASTPFDKEIIIGIVILSFQYLRG